MNFRMIAAAVVASVVAAPSTAECQSTPHELAEVLTRAIAAADSALIRAVVHPASVTFAGGDRISATLVGILARRDLGAEMLSESGPITVRVVPVSELENYDAAAREYRLGSLAFEFSADAAPSHFLYIERTETSSTATGARLTSRGIVEGIVQQRNRWVLTVSRLAR
jgi:hypothetical protein